MKRSTLRLLGSLVLLAGLLAPSQVQAQGRRFFRARFRPGTLEIQRPGQLELQGELGAMYGDGEDGSRLLLPGLAISLGILKWLEVDFDSAFVQTQLGRDDTQFVGQPLWLSVRVDLYNVVSKKTGSSFGIGAQVGPRLPSVHNARGIGAGALGLIGGGSKTLHAVANLGTTVDAEQSIALNYGVSVEYELELRHKWSLLGELAGARYVADDPDPNQLLINVGFGAELQEHLELSLLAVTGPVFDGDRFGLLLGLSYDRDLW